MKLTKELVNEFLNFYDFELVNHGSYWTVHDLQGANLAHIEEERFETLRDVIARFDGSAYENDYIWNDLHDEFSGYSELPSIKNESQDINEIIKDLKGAGATGHVFMLEILRDYDIAEEDEKMERQMVLTEEQLCSLKRDTQEQLLNALCSVEDDLGYDCKEVSNTVDFLQNIDYRAMYLVKDKNGHNYLRYSDSSVENGTPIAEEQEFTFIDHETKESFKAKYGIENDGMGDLLWITIEDEQGVYAQICQGYLDKFYNEVDLDDDVLCEFVNSDEYNNAYGKKEEK